MSTSRCFVILFSVSISYTPITSVADSLLSRDDYIAAKPSFTDVKDQSVFDVLFADGNEFDIVVVETNDNDEGDVIHMSIKKRKFLMKHPTVGNFRASFKQYKDNELRIYWKPGVVYTYHASCGTIKDKKQCGLMDDNRMAWGFPDPRH